MMQEAELEGAIKSTMCAMFSTVDKLHAAESIRQMNDAEQHLDFFNTNTRRLSGSIAVFERSRSKEAYHHVIADVQTVTGALKEINYASMKVVAAALYDTRYFKQNGYVQVKALQDALQRDHPELHQHLFHTIEADRQKIVKLRNQTSHGKGVETITCNGLQHKSEKPIPRAPKPYRAVPESDVDRMIRQERSTDKKRIKADMKRMKRMKRIEDMYPLREFKLFDDEDADDFYGYDTFLVGNSRGTRPKQGLDYTSFRDDDASPKSDSFSRELDQLISLCYPRDLLTLNYDRHSIQSIIPQHAQTEELRIMTPSGGSQPLKEWLPTLMARNLKHIAKTYNLLREVL